MVVAAGMRCVPMRPLVDAPQMKKVAVSSQKSRERTPSPRAARAPAGPRPGSAGHRGLDAGAAEGRQADICGALAKKQDTIGIAQQRGAGHDERCGPPSMALDDRARSGRKTNWPVAVDCREQPIASPRRAANQRFTTVAPEHQRHHPAARPDEHAPDHHQLPRGRDLRGEGHASRQQRECTEGRPPNAQPLHQSAGERTHQPVQEMLTEIATEMVERVQPNSCSSGTMRTLGVARMPAPASRTRKVAARTSQAEWGRRKAMVGSMYWATGGSSLPRQNLRRPGQVAASGAAIVAEALFK